MKRLLFVVILILLSSFAYGDSLSVAVTTKTYGGQFAPRICLAIWVTNASNKFIRSLKVCANFPNYGQYLTNWVNNSGQNRTDAITSASLNNHVSHNLVWDCKDVNKTLVANGIYRVYVEVTEDNGTGRVTYYEFTKGASVQNLVFPDVNVFYGAKLNYKPSGPPDTKPPTAPSALTASNITTNSCTLKWTASTDSVGVTGYEVYKDNILVGTSKTATLNLADLICGTSGLITVKGLDAAGNKSPASNAVTVTTLACVAGAEITVNDNSSRVSYTGAWTYTSPELQNINDDEHLTSAANASASLTFIGSSISWIATALGNRGIADVYIDNVKVSSVDAYSAAVAYQKVLYTNATLAPGSHTIKVVNTGTKNAAGTGTYMLVDAFKYTNPKISGINFIPNTAMSTGNFLDVSINSLGKATFNYSAPKNQNMTLSVYSVSGKQIWSTNLLNTNQVVWNNQLANGTYFVSLKDNNINLSKKFVVIR